MPRKKNKPDSDLLRAARDVFLEDGIAASTRKIAEHAGVSEGVLFQRFGSKQTLFFEAMRLPPADFKAAVDRSQRAKTVLEGTVILALAGLDYLRSIMPQVLLVLTHPGRRDLFRRHGDGSHDLLFEAFGLNSMLNGFFLQKVNAKMLPDRDYPVLTSILLATLLTRAFHEQMGIDDPAEAETWIVDIVRTLVQPLETD